MATVSFKCKNCGGELLFDPDSQKFHCEYCDSYFTREELGEEPESKTEDPAPRAETVQPEEEFNEGEVVEYTCPSCGAQVIAEASTAATWCYYCHNPVVLSSRLSNKLKPNKVIPFVLDKEQAENAFEQWKKKKWFLKPGFSREARLEKMSGVYYPIGASTAAPRGVSAVMQRRSVPGAQGIPNIKKRKNTNLSVRARSNCGILPLPP